MFIFVLLPFNFNKGWIELVDEQTLTFLFSLSKELSSDLVRREQQQVRMLDQLREIQVIQN